MIGVFTAFTLSQTGMVRYWLRTHDPGWRRRALINGVGALATFVVTLVVIWTKFAAGAWMVIIAIPLLVLAFLGIHRHYRKIARRLRAGTAAVRSAGIPATRSSSSADTVDVATESALWYARQIAGRRRARSARAGPRSRTRRSGPAGSTLAGREPRLELLDPAEGRIDAVLEELWKLPRGERDVVTVVIPEQFRRRSLLAAAPPNVVPTQASPPLGAGSRRRRRAHDQRQHEPRRTDADALITRILVADVNAASMRAVNYAQSLDADDVRAVFFAARRRGGARSSRQPGEPQESSCRSRSSKRRTATSATRSSATSDS